MTELDDAVRLLHLLGHLYGCHGQTKRGATYLLLAAQLSPEDTGILKTLAYLLTLEGETEKAFAIIERLENLEEMDQPGLALLKSRALLAAGRTSEARSTFRHFLTQKEDRR